MKRSLTQKSDWSSSRVTHLVGTAGHDADCQKSQINGSTLRASATMLGIAALSMGATTGLMLVTPGEEAIAAESALSQPLIQHRVQDGDTLWDLSQAYGVPAEAIAASNALTKDSLLPVGETLNIPVIRELGGQAASEATSVDAQEIVLALADGRETSVEVVTSSEPAVLLPQDTVDAVEKKEKALAPVVMEPTDEVSEAEPAVVAIAPRSQEPPAEVAGPTVVLPTTSTQRTRVHNIAPGETIDALAVRYGLSTREILALNQDVEPTNLQIGQGILLPEDAREVSTTTRAAVEPEVEVAQLQTVTASAAPAAGDHIDRLKADVLRMREEIRAQNESRPIIAQNPTLASTTPTAPAPVSPNWERQQLNKPSRPESRPVSPAADAETPNLLAVAPAPAQGYNRLLNLPAGQSVEPQIPPLLEQDEYLPDRPQEFNGYIWPARGVLTSGYGPRWGRMHRGIDIAAPTGTPIHAAASGVVVTAGWNNGGYGNFVEIRHPDGSLTRYAHNSRILVRKGDRVEQGQQIALMGSTGFSTGPHLHFEIHPAGSGAVDPMAFLPSSRN